MLGVSLPSFSYPGRFFLQALHGVDPSLCRGYKKMLQKGMKQTFDTSVLTQIGAENRPTDDEFHCISVGCFTFGTLGMVVVGQEGHRHMVILGFAFPLEAGVVSLDISHGDNRRPRHTKNERVLSIRGGNF